MKKIIIAHSFENMDRLNKFIDGNVLKDDILPRAQHYFTLTMKGYDEGRLEYLEVLNGKRTLIETKKRYVKALHILQLSVANLERLCSRHLHGDEGEMF